MLDQNTDRLWYVIGAVLVGAAIILLLNGTAPDLFAQVAGAYEDLTEDATSGAESLMDDGSKGTNGTPIAQLDQGADMISRDNMEIGSFNFFNGDLKPANKNQFERMIDPVPVTPNTKYYISYELESHVPDGWGTEVAWVYYDQEGNPISGNGIYSHYKEEKKTVRFTTPENAHSIRVRFGRTEEPITPDTERNYYMAEYEAVQEQMEQGGV